MNNKKQIEEDEDDLDYDEPEDNFHYDTPSLENCDDAGTGEGKYHGRM